MATLDWVLAGVLFFSLLLGAWRGLVYEVLSVLGWAASFYVAQWYAPQAATLLPLQSASEPVRYAAAFVLVFIAAVFLRPVDRTLGAAFGVLRGVILLLAAAVVMDMTALQSSPWWQESRGASALTATLQGLKPVLPEQFAKYLN